MERENLQLKLTENESFADRLGSWKIQIGISYESSLMLATILSIYVAFPGGHLFFLDCEGVPPIQLWWASCLTGNNGKLLGVFVEISGFFHGHNKGWVNERFVKCLPFDIYMYTVYIYIFTYLHPGSPSTILLKVVLRTTIFK